MTDLKLDAFSVAGTKLQVSGAEDQQIQYIQD